MLTRELGVGQRRQQRRSGVAALEFALIAPVMVTLLFGMVDIAAALTALKRTNTVALETAKIVTELSIQSDQTTTFSPAQLHQASTLIYAVFPDLRGYAVIDPSKSSYAVTVSDIAFDGSPKPCDAGLSCSTYTAAIAWSVALDKGQQIVRPCGPVDQVTPTVLPSNSNVPTAGMKSLKSVIAVDVLYRFTPFFGAFLTGPINMRRTAYLNQRTNKSAYIYYDTSANPHVCPTFI